ncbi:unnamed protein product [Strongylus vulgaris]|uniref:Uncharacterized protein n=1 Tax=Strongylus vulgaris TaxID=40348 RepID=A0A3P7J8Y0_STRVU|nr:unnamed protein product [Strongylus vulgaris]
MLYLYNKTLRRQTAFSKQSITDSRPIFRISRAVGFKLKGLMTLPYQFAFCEDDERRLSAYPWAAPTMQDAQANFEEYVADAAKKVVVDRGIANVSNDTTLQLMYSPINCCFNDNYYCRKGRKLRQIYDNTMLKNISVGDIIGIITVNVLFISIFDFSNARICPFMFVNDQ